MEGTRRVFHPKSSARICGIDQQGPFVEPVEAKSQMTKSLLLKMAING